jgi:O-antigen ligase
MLNLPSIRPILIKDVEANDLSLSERVIYWTIILTPVWWLLGIQPLFYPAAIVTLLIVNFRFEKLIQRSFPSFVWAWLVMSIVTLWTAALGINDMGFNLQTALAAVVTFMKSYFLIFACLALPYLSRVRAHIITRATAWMASGFLVTISIELTLLILKIGGDRFTPPLARLLPGDKGSLQVILANFSPFLGIPLPRTVLYTPDPPILGVCAVLCFAICVGETNKPLRNLALAGSIAALLLSASRSALLCFPLSIAIVGCFQSGLFRQLSLWLTTLTLLACSVLGITIPQLLEQPVQVFNEARNDSSLERALVVRKTLEAWQESPWIGWGVIRGKTHLYEDTYIGLGSFSTYSAVLYLNGIVGFVALIVAMLLTLFAVFQRALQGNNLCKWGFACLVTLYISCNATPLSWMAANLWFFFVWLGAVIFEARPARSAGLSWDRLSGQTDE